MYRTVFIYVFCKRKILIYLTDEVQVIEGRYTTGNEGDATHAASIWRHNATDRWDTQHLQQSADWVWAATDSISNSKNSITPPLFSTML